MNETAIKTNLFAYHFIKILCNFLPRVLDNDKYIHELQDNMFQNKCLFFKVISFTVTVYKNLLPKNVFKSK